jgi:hypothetical protein
MGRAVKDYWHWTRITVPYEKDWRKALDSENFLKEAANDREYHITVTTEYPNGAKRSRYDTKHITAYHYYMKDESLASWFSLKYA